MGSERSEGGRRSGRPRARERLLRAGLRAARRGARWAARQPPVQRQLDRLQGQGEALREEYLRQRARLEARLLEWLDELEREGQRYFQSGPRQISAPEAYERLGLPPGASYPEVRRAWRRLMRVYHPDRAMRAGAEQIALAEQEAKRLNEAHEYLKSYLGAR